MNPLPGKKKKIWLRKSSFWPFKVLLYASFYFAKQTVRILKLSKVSLLSDVNLQYQSVQAISKLLAQFSFPQLDCFENAETIQLACEQALLFGLAKRASRERVSEGPRKALLFGLAKRASRERVSEGPRKALLFGLAKRALRDRASHLGRGKESSQRDSAKRENCHRKRAADQKISDNRLSSKFRQPRASNYLFINRSRNSIKAMFLITDIFFFSTETSNFNVSARIRAHYFDSRFVYF